MDSRRCKVLALQTIGEIGILDSEIFEQPVPGWLQDSGQCLNLPVLLDQIRIIVVGLRDSVASCRVAVQIDPPIALVLENVVAMELEHSVDAARLFRRHIRRIIVETEDLGFHVAPGAQPQLHVRISAELARSEQLSAYLKKRAGASRFKALRYKFPNMARSGSPKKSRFQYVWRQYVEMARMSPQDCQLT